MNTSLDEDLTVINDLDFDPTCTADGQNCSNTATWHMHKNCCGEEFLFCTKCRTFLITYMNTNQKVRCKMCNTWFDGFDGTIVWTKL
jgi:LSD1 subclass zinc finger protein